jgi:hypothetical protein
MSTSDHEMDTVRAPKESRTLAPAPVSVLIAPEGCVTC